MPSFCYRVDAALSVLKKGSTLRDQSVAVGSGSFDFQINVERIVPFHMPCFDQVSPQSLFSIFVEGVLYVAMESTFSKPIVHESLTHDIDWVCQLVWQPQSCI